MRNKLAVGIGLALALAGSAGIAAAQGAPARPDRGTEHGRRGGARAQGDMQHERGAQDRGRGMRGPGMRGRGGPDGLLLKGITLTGEQRSQIAQLRKTQRQDMKSAREQRARRGNAQRDAMRAARERGDTAAMRDIMRRNREVIAQERTQHIAAIRNILTAEQRVQFDRNVADLQARMEQRGRGRGR